ncbi:MAG TPA: NAD(P)/FAD-dependent oxidoreductase [Vicinamibacterales bacterium]|nr:NAD(P)/FAD-dependent oxidoreductase [Vicinamibacterales bacterium]
MFVERVEYVIVGAGPAGLRAAQVLAEAGRDVLVLERHPVVGPKTCAGALSPKAACELAALGLPPEAGRIAVAEISFRGERPRPLDAQAARVMTVARAVLGRYQRGWAERAGATIRTGMPVTAIDIHGRSVSAGGRRIRYRTLIGADGSCSIVRRAAGLPIRRRLFAAEYNVPQLPGDRLQVLLDSPALGSGYFWVFPHRDYVSIGAGADNRVVPPPQVRRHLDERLARSAIDVGATPLEAAAIEVDFAGFHPAPGVHLAGDAAGVASALTGEGIYAALVTGEEVARRLLDPRFPMPKTRAWLRMKRRHDRLAALWRRRVARDLSIAMFRPLARLPAGRRWLSTLFLG